MKTLLLALSLTLGLAASAQAAKKIEKEKIECEGLDQNSGYTMTMDARSQSNVEGKAIAYYLEVLGEHQEPLFANIVFGVKEDVMLNFKSKAGVQPKLSGLLYMDEADQTWVKLNGDELRFSCQLAN